MKKHLAIALFIFFLSSIYALDTSLETYKKTLNKQELHLLIDNIRWAEGPMWDPQSQELLVSDMGNNRIMRWRPREGKDVYVENCGKTNGRKINKKGELITCMPGIRSIRIQDKNQRASYLSLWEKKRLNGPNDLCFAPDGSLWFTDPDFEVRRNKEVKQIKGNYVFRYTDGKLTAMVKTMTMPNGICFSPDGKYLYVVEYSNKEGSIKRFTLSEDGKKISDEKVFVTISKGDGIIADKEGNIYAAAIEGINIYSPEGKLIKTIKTPERAVNLCWGEDEETLFISTASKAYIYLK